MCSNIAPRQSITAIKLRKKEFILISPPPTPSIKRGLKSKKKSPLNRLT